MVIAYERRKYLVEVITTTTPVQDLDELENEMIEAIARVWGTEMVQVDEVEGL